MNSKCVNFCQKSLKIKRFHANQWCISSRFAISCLTFMKAGEKYENLYFRVAQIDLFVHPKNMATSFDQSQEPTFAKSRHNFGKKSQLLDLKIQLWILTENRSLTFVKGRKSQHKLSVIQQKCITPFFVPLCCPYRQSIVDQKWKNSIIPWLMFTRYQRSKLFP